MYKAIWLLSIFSFTQDAFAQLQKRAEISLVDAEMIIENNKQYCDSILTRKGYYVSNKDSVIVKSGMRTYTYINKKDFTVKVMIKGDSLKMINWDEPISTIHLLFREADLLDYKPSENNPGIFDNKYRKNILIVVPQVSRIKSTNAMVLAKKK